MKMIHIARFVLVAGGLFISAALLLSSPSHAADDAVKDQSAGAVQLTAEHIGQLINRLDDPERRAQLIDDLRALMATMEGAAGDDQPAPDLLSAVLESLAGRLADVGNDIATLAQNAGEPSIIANWFLEQVQNAERRGLWFNILIYLGAMIVAGFLVAFGLTKSLAGVRQKVEWRERPNLIVRVPLLLLRTLIDITPLIGFAAAGYIVLALGGPGRIVGGVVLSAVHAVVIALALIAVARMVFTPLSPALRLFPLPDGTAA